MHMLRAGLGDILGKYTALADWHIAKILNNEYFCSNVEELVIKVIENCVKASTNLQKRDYETIKNITDALIMSGLTIGMIGASRPASGEEHHLSHCWEMMFMDREIQTKWLHGNNVGVGVGIIIEAYKFLSTLDMELLYREKKYLDFDKASWVQNLSEVYGKSSKNIIEAKLEYINFDREAREKRMITIVNKWEQIKKICDEYLPSGEAVRKILKDTGAISSPVELGLNKEDFKKSFIAAKDIRKRYGVLQLLEDIGKLEESAEIIANIYYR
jgi:glycerol-1-phosphate dehydrogenase [NAD(P)+]